MMATMMTMMMMNLFSNSHKYCIIYVRLYQTILQQSYWLNTKISYCLTVQEIYIFAQFQDKFYTFSLDLTAISGLSGCNIASDYIIRLPLALNSVNTVCILAVTSY